MVSIGTLNNSFVSLSKPSERLIILSCKKHAVPCPNIPSRSISPILNPPPLDLPASG